MVFDLCTFNGEYDVLEIRLNVLDTYVDKFVIGEAELTFSGHAKPLYFELQKERYKKFWPKIIYSIVRDYYNPRILSYMQRQMDMQNTGYPFLMAFYQKENLQGALFDLAKDSDTIYYGDCDELWKPQEVQDMPLKLEQLNYSMHLNRRSSQIWRGTIVTTYAKVKEYGLSQIRMKASEISKDGGWHFSNMGGVEEVKRKLRSYDHQEVNTEENINEMEGRVKNSTDFLGRNYIQTTDESGWPEYLKENRDKYKHLLWQ